MNIVIKKTRNNRPKIIQHHGQVADLNQQNWRLHIRGRKKV